jgi:alpha-2-macroglobulin
MHGKRTAIVVGVTLSLFSAAVWLIAADQAAPQRDTLMKTFQAGNFKDAYEGLRKLALDPKDDPAKVGQDLTTAITCLQRLGRSDEIDDVREAVIDAHKGNWRLLETAAESYVSNQMEHYGFIVAGKFHRGGHRGGGRYVGSMERDRTRALQLMQQALTLTAKEDDKLALARFHLHFAHILLNGAGWHDAWRLQYLTDLKELPDYQEGYWYYRGNTRGAPVDANGKPIYYHIPKSYETAQNDGERWRWMLAQTAELDPGRVNEIDMQLANFCRSQFGVQTMAQFGHTFNGGDSGERKTGTFALHTLKDDETIAKLATGLQRFTLPDELNWIKISERVAGRGKSEFGEQARDLLAGEYEDRRQYVKSAEAWKKAIAEYGAGHDNYRQKRLDQIVGSWGRFEPGETQPAGKKAIVDFRYRNGNKVSLEAHAIKITKLLDDVKAYLKNKPGQIDWNVVNIGNIGYRLVEQNQQQYLGDKVASWDVDLKPRPAHVDERISITTPMDKAGAYLVTATMQGGNVSRIIVWVSDTVILKKQLDGQSFYYVADAVSGQPIAKAEVEFFGWRQQYLGNNNRWQIDTTSFQDNTDANGEILLGQNKVPQSHQWLITARTKKDGKEGQDRFAYLGFTGIWYGRRYDAEYNAVKVFTMTDRPVYRPEQKVQFAAWLEHAKYDQNDSSAFAQQTFKVRIHNPKNEKVFEQNYTTDGYGGLSGDFPLAKGITLGVYQLHIFDASGQVHHGSGHFRVEEYKKPEFEVTVEAPKEPVRLGEKIKATVTAKYYFGAPVVRAKVKYKVLRSSYDERWYPRGAWDWFYGRGYWWFAADYLWYPGWHEWGCKRPIPVWWWRGREQPEVVLENEVEIGADGTVEIPIDTTAAKELHGDSDHKYSITAEVTDESRRTIVGTGDVLVARKPFQVFAWVNRGYFRAGDTIQASFRAQTLDQKPVEGKGELTLFRISYDDKNEPVEKAVETWKLDTDVEGKAQQQMKAAESGQYRLSYKLTDAKQHTIEGGYVFVVRGQGFDGRDYRFNDIELITDKREYKPGEKVQLLINTNRNDGVVLLFVRPTNGIYLPPRLLRLKGKSIAEDVAVVQKDMPNFFIEAVTVANGGVHTDVREVIVPPEKRVLNVDIQPSQKEYLPGQKATVKVKLTDFFGKPFVGSTVLSIYDKSVEYIAGGSNVPEIREFFWKWRRHHNPASESSLSHHLGELLKHQEIGMANLGIFGATVVEELKKAKGEGKERQALKDGDAKMALNAGPAAPGAAFGGREGGEQFRRARGVAMDEAAAEKKAADKPGAGERAEQAEPGAGALGVPPTVRKNFADTALWTASLTTDKDGFAEVSLTMPENLTAWKVKVWAMGAGTRVGQGDAEVVTKKNLIVRLQAPRFFVQKDEVVLSANVHNYLKSQKSVKVSLELEGGTLAADGETTRAVSIPADGEQRVDWRVKVISEGDALVRMKAVSDEESDAMQMLFPCYVHGMLKTDSFSGVVRAEQKSGSVVFQVPAERRINETLLEVRYSPTLAGAMVDALPYLVEYPYGCTEQTLNRFLPTIITQRVLQNMKLNLKDIEKKRTNLNAQEIGDDKKRAEGWKRYQRNPVFDEDEVHRMVQAGLDRLAAMQCSDGGWGWFSGWGEHSWPHTTAVVVHGLQIARDNNVALPQGMLERGIAWLKNYQGEQVQHLRNAPARIQPWKDKADNLDAFVYMVLGDAGAFNNDMREYLYRDRVDLAVYAKAMFGLALYKEQQADKLAMILKNIEQFVVQDEENQTAYLRLPAGNAWWCWYGSEIEAEAYYLKLLSRTSPKDAKAAGLVKYLLNNRKHATYWNSTRDTAVCIEAMADYLKASGEDKPDMTVEVWLDGKKHKEVKIDAGNLFSFDNKLMLKGDAIESGKHTLEIKRQGTGPVYFNAYLTNFTLEDFITRAGLEVKVNRKYYKLTRVDAATKVSGARGQALDQKIEKFKRTELPNLSSLKSGDLVEVELEIDSKNDYEYLIFEDPKAAGFEPMLVRSGYNANDMGAYMELRDEKVCFFVRQLARGKHSLAYRLRAEIPGKFSALPTRGYAMYAPELKGNSDEIKLAIED